MHSAFLFLTLLQSPGADPMISRLDREAIFRQLEPNDQVAWEEAARRDAALQQQEFVEKFNKFAKALSDFGSTYNTSGVIDAKKIKELKKAWHDLEKAEPWLADEKRK